jgi:hypothetical protein
MNKKISLHSNLEKKAKIMMKEEKMFKRTQEVFSFYYVPN